MSRLVLFVPVSSGRGAGEVMRCVTIATALQRAEPGFRIHFLVSRHAPCHAAIPFPTTPLEDSPSHCSSAVVGAVEALQPDLVVFDSAARRGPLRRCRELGISTLFISSRRKSRARAFQPGRLALLDGVLLIQPRFVDGALSLREKLSCALVGGRSVFSADTVFDEPDATPAPPDVPNTHYVLFSSGGGGVRENRPDASDVFYQAATLWSAASGVASVLLLGPNCPDPQRFQSDAQVSVLDSVDTTRFTQLVARAQYCVIGGGSGMAQALALGKHCVAVATGKDQPKRIRACTERQLAVTSELDPAAIASALCHLDKDSTLQQAISRSLAASGIQNGLAQVVDMLRFHAGARRKGAGFWRERPLYQPR